MRRCAALPLCCRPQRRTLGVRSIPGARACGTRTVCDAGLLACCLPAAATWCRRLPHVLPPLALRKQNAIIVCYVSLQRKHARAQEKDYRAYGQNEIMHAYGPESTPIAQGLVKDINAKAHGQNEIMHAYGPESTPIAQGLVEDINAKHAYDLALRL